MCSCSGEHVAIGPHLAPAGIGWAPAQLDLLAAAQFIVKQFDVGRALGELDGALALLSAMRTTVVDHQVAVHVEQVSRRRKRC